MADRFYRTPEEANESESVSQQITRLLGTDKWSLSIGGQFIVDADLDELEARQGRVE